MNPSLYFWSLHETKKKLCVSEITLEAFGPPPSRLRLSIDVIECKDLSPTAVLVLKARPHRAYAASAGDHCLQLRCGHHNFMSKVETSYLSSNGHGFRLAREHCIHTIVNVWQAFPPRILSALCCSKFSFLSWLYLKIEWFSQMLRKSYHLLSCNLWVGFDLFWGRSLWGVLWQCLTLGLMLPILSYPCHRAHDLISE